MSEFSDAIRASGLEPPLSIEPGVVIRFPGIGKGAKNKAAWCRLFDDCMGGVFGDYSSGLYEVWQSRRTHTYTPDQRAEFMRQVEASRKQHAQERARDAQAAAKRAQAIVAAAAPEPHAYLDSKGWRDTGLVWYPSEGVNLLVIPMRIDGALAGCQLIDRDGNKKFLKGQRTNGAEYVFGARGVDVWCEGYATARSISECLALAGLPARVHACFSAGNLQRMAKSGVVVADNDPGSCAGIKAAKSTGLPYWVSDSPGEDFNDFHQRIGTFKAGMELRKFLLGVRRLAA